MERLRDLRRNHKKAWFALWILLLAGVLGGAQWQLGAGNPIAAQVLGTQAKKPDVTPPSVSVSTPVNNGVYRASTWAGAASGSASDAAGVARVDVAVQQQAGGKYWTGTAFTSTTIVWLASGTTTWSQPLPLTSLSDGVYKVSVQATDAATPAPNTSSPIAVTFRVDTVAPVAPTFTKTPESPTFDTKAPFNWVDAEAGVSFVCALDGAAPATCDASGNELKNLPVGTHTFAVWAVDAAGNRSTTGASWSWMILENKSFGISGTISGPFSPGVTQPLDLVLANPYNFSISVTSVTVAVASPTTKTSGQPNPTCDGPTNLRVTQQLVGPVSLAASATRSLTQLGVASSKWPQLHMPDLPDFNQDACKDTTFKLSYTGTATK